MSQSITVTLTVTNGVYTIGDAVGGLITFKLDESSRGKNFVINSIKLSGKVANPYYLRFYNADIATPAADNAPLNLAAADGAKFLGGVPITAADYKADAAAAFNDATVRQVGLQVMRSTGLADILAYLQTESTTSPGTTTLYITVDFEDIY